MVADHLVEVDGIGALRDRGEQAARLDLAKLLGVADQDQLAPRPPRRGRSVAPGAPSPTIPASSTRRTEREESADARRGRGRRSRLATLVASSPSARRTLAARQVGAATRSSKPACAQPSAAATVAKLLPVPGLADHHDDALAARRAGGGPSRAGRPSGSVGPRSPGCDQLARPRRAVSAAIRSRRLERLALKLPDPLGGDSGCPLAVSATLITDSEARKASAALSTSWPGRRWGAGRRRPGSRRGGRSGRRGPSPRGRAASAVSLAARLDLAGPSSRDRLAVEADLLRLLAPALAQALVERSASPSPRGWRASRPGGRGPRHPPRPPRVFPRGGSRRLAATRPRSPRSRRCRCEPAATRRRASGSARGEGGPRRCSRRSWRARRSPGGRAGSSGRPAPGSRWRSGHGCGAGDRRFARSGGGRRRRGSRCR